MTYIKLCVRTQPLFTYFYPKLRFKNLGEFKAKNTIRAIKDDETFGKVAKNTYLCGKFRNLYPIYRSNCTVVTTLAVKQRQLLIKRFVTLKFLDRIHREMGPILYYILYIREEDVEKTHHFIPDYVGAFLQNLQPHRQRQRCCEVVLHIWHV